MLLVSNRALAGDLAGMVGAVADSRGVQVRALTVVGQPVDWQAPCVKFDPSHGGPSITGVICGGRLHFGHSARGQWHPVGEPVGEAGFACLSPWRGDAMFRVRGMPVPLLIVATSALMVFTPLPVLMRFTADMGGVIRPPGGHQPTTLHLHVGPPSACHGLSTLALVSGWSWFGRR